jgi:hypothetical protein
MASTAGKYCFHTRRAEKVRSLHTCMKYWYIDQNMDSKKALLPHTGKGIEKR